ncbi:hypothetical protein [Candidatus Villigracilis affinis]|uniref:hypothetical protein n=1 Tax=Candidatus Villigracilis affinis TaxID=3140682 RepID=UPI002A2122C2|nr:hypothetical protein [Anaerolineales bacterium]
MEINLTDAPSRYFISYSRETRKPSGACGCLAQAWTVGMGGYEKLTHETPHGSGDRKDPRVQCSDRHLSTWRQNDSEWVSEVSFAGAQQAHFPCPAPRDESSNTTLRMINHQLIDSRQNEKEGAGETPTIRFPIIWNW